MGNFLRTHNLLIPFASDLDRSTHVDINRSLNPQLFQLIPGFFQLQNSSNPSTTPINEKQGLTRGGWGGFQLRVCFFLLFPVRVFVKLLFS